MLLAEGGGTRSREQPQVGGAFLLRTLHASRSGFSATERQRRDLRDLHLLSSKFGGPLADSGKTQPAGFDP